VPHPVRAGVGRPPPATPVLPTTTTTAGRPLPAWVRLEVERAELIHADDHVRVAVQDVVGSIHQPVQVQNAVLLGLEVRVG
jgi:hypothetical protein